MKSKLYTILLLISCFVYGQVEWEFNNNKNKVVIPFDSFSNLIIVKTELNNQPLNLILDTGSSYNILFNFPENKEYVFNQTSKLHITGPGLNKPIEAIESKNNHFKIGDLITNNLGVLIITEGFEDIITQVGLPIHGILGADFFKNNLVEIQYSHKKIIIHKNHSKKLTKYISNFNTLPVTFQENKPFLETSISLDNTVKDSMKLLVDTGLSDGVWLIEDKLNNITSQTITDFLGQGFGGDIFGKKARFKNISFSNYTLEEPIISFPDSIAFTLKNINKSRNGSIGGAILKRFTILFDYKNNKIYTKPNQDFFEPFNYNMSGIEIQHSGLDVVKEVVRNSHPNNAINLNEYIFDNSELNYKYTLKPGVEVTHVRINSPAYLVGVKPGDKIISINNRKTIYMTLESINEIFHTKFDETILIEIERNNKSMTFSLALKKEI